MTYFANFLAVRMHHGTLLCADEVKGAEHDQCNTSLMTKRQK